MAGKKTLKDIVAGGGSDAEKFRDFLGRVMVITDFTEVATKNGPKLHLTAYENEGGPAHIIWSPDIVAHQVREIAENELLPARVVFTAKASKSGREFFTLDVLEEEVPDSARTEPPEGGDE
jgi:hypothetical protein